MPNYKITLYNAIGDEYSIYTDFIFWKSDEVFRIGQDAKFGFIVKYDCNEMKKIYFVIDGEEKVNNSWNKGYTDILIYGSYDTIRIKDLLYHYNVIQHLDKYRRVERLWFNENHKCNECDIIYSELDNSKACINGNLRHKWCIIINDEKFNLRRNRFLQYEENSKKIVEMMNNA